ncbi:MAG: hypothetical protein ACFB0E_20280 [Leptolyngbyaceae cyanobacterium]
MSTAFEKVVMGIENAVRDRLSNLDAHTKKFGIARLPATFS